MYRAFRALPVGIAALAAMFLILGQGPSPAEAATVVVTSNADSGPGTFRAAVDQANGNSSITVIKFLTNGPITLQSSVEYYGSQPLSLMGLFNTVIQGSNVTSTGGPSTACHSSGLFESNNGADLTLVSLTFQNNPCGNGVYVELDDDYDVNILVNKVVMRDNSRNGLRILEDSDCSGGTDIYLTILYSTFSGNDEYDGVIVEDNGDGSVTANLKFSQFRDNYEDGFDIEEDCNGDVSLTTFSSSFNGNGDDGLDVDEYDDGWVNATLNGLDATNNDDDGVNMDEQDYSNIGSVSVGTEGDDAAENDQPAPVDGPEAATCYGDDLSLTVNGGRASNNGSDGFDINEYDCGSLWMTATGVVASGNDDDGFDVYEESGGDLNFTANSATTADFNGQDDEDGNGIQLYEDGYGSLNANLASSAARFNGDWGESGDGIDLEEHYYGDLNLNMGLTVVLSNRDDGLDMEEFGCGTIDATLVSSTVSLNADDGIDAEQEYDCSDGDGEVTLIFTSVIGNADSNLELDGVIQN